MAGPSLQPPLASLGVLGCEGDSLWPEFPVDRAAGRACRACALLVHAGHAGFVVAPIIAPTGKQTIADRNENTKTIYAQQVVVTSSSSLLIVVSLCIWFSWADSHTQTARTSSEQFSPVAAPE